MNNKGAVEAAGSPLDCDQNRQEKPCHFQNSPIAIIGIAFRFPGDLSDEKSLWDALKNQQDQVRKVPSNRWPINELQHDKRSEPGRSITFSAGVLSRIDEFDAAFFGISPREAAWMDPQQRLLLELAWEAMENAQVPPSSLAGSDCAVYVGISSLDYGTRGLDDLASISPHLMTGNTLSIAANRLSYVFDLHGPSLAVDTACSSSLVALHHACRALQTDEASTAMVGGVNLLLHPYPFVGFTKASMLSADGRCKSFDASGNGYVRAEGGAVLLLKPLDKALADGDDIQAVILASGVNADGARKTGITIPSRDGQAELMKSVLAKSGLSALDVDFVEAHGTGTAVGDPVETAAIGEVYGRGREAPLPIGSIKANLGHLEPASGMAGLVKAILCLQHRALPPQIHLNERNPHIDFQALNLEPVTHYRTLSKNGEKPLIAGVNSFGFGGANSHVLLQEYLKTSSKTPRQMPESAPPLVLSARSDDALRDLAGRYAAQLGEASSQDYYNIAYAAAYRRERLEKRLALSGASLPDIEGLLAAFADGEATDEVILEDALAESGGIAFIYSGNGAQWIGMGLRLLAESTRFADILNDLDVRMEPVAGFSVLTELQATGESSRLNDTVVAQPLLFAIQAAATLLLREQGVEPTAVAGHSVGEVAAAWASGAFDLDTAIHVIVARSQAQGETRGTGRMAAVGMSASAMQSVLDDLNTSDMTIAGLNSPNSITLSGSLEDLVRVQSYLDTKGIFFRLLDLDYAFHSQHMDIIQDRLLAALAGLKPASTDAAAFVSTVTGAVLDGSCLDANYWWRNVREPVRFADAIAVLAQLGCRVFIEIGPHAILQRYVSESLAAVEIKGRVLPLLRKEADGWSRIVDTALRAQLLTASPDFTAYFAHAGAHVRLPNYPWQRERHWHPRTSESLLSLERRRVHSLLGWRIPEAEWSWENCLDATILPWLADHRVGGAMVFPGSAYAEMALAAASEWTQEQSLVFEELDILSPLVFDGTHARSLRFDLNPRDGGFQIKSRQRVSTDEWTLHAAGRILSTGSRPSCAHIAPLSATAESISQETHYRLADKLGLDYGPAFRGLQQALVVENYLEATLDLPPEANDGHTYHLHPSLLDVCYQSLVDFFRNEIDVGEGAALLPIKVGRLELNARGVVRRFRAQLRRRGMRSVLADFELFDAENNLIARVSDCRFRAAPLLHKDRDSISRWQITALLHPHPADELSTQLPSSRELAEQIRLSMTAEEGQRLAWFKEALPLFEALILSFAYEACRELEQRGILQPLLVSSNAPSNDGPSSNAYTRWLTSLLQLEGLLVQQDDQWCLMEDSDLPAAKDIWRTLLSDHPTCLPQLVLLGRVGRYLPELLAGEMDRRELAETLQHVHSAETLYEADPAYAGTCRAIEGVLHQLADNLPEHRRLRVLELAPGFSELPRALLHLLPEDRIDYVLALTDEDVAGRQQVEYAEFSNLTIATLNHADWKLTVSKTLLQKFDVVILRHVLHRALSPTAALTQAKGWLANGGCLLVAERYPDWSADFLAGLDPAWWYDPMPQTLDVTLPLSSLRPLQSWEDALRQESFDDVLGFTESAADGLAQGAYLLLARRPLDTLALPMPDPESWLLLTDTHASAFAEHLRIRLESLGQRVDIAHRLHNLDVTDMQHVVHLCGWAESANAVNNVLSGLLSDVQTLAGLTPKPPRLWLITHGGALADYLPPAFAPNPVQAAIWGFGRVIMNEQPALNCTLIDLVGDTETSHLPALLENELLRPDGNNEIVLSESGRHVLVMRERNAPAPTEDDETARFRLDFRIPGQLRNLLWLPMGEHVLHEGEIEVQTHAVGLNFRDVMYLMGLLPDEAVENGFAGASLGLEFSGVVTNVGAGVRDLQVGDRVMGFGSSCFASHVVTRADAVALMPEAWTFDAAATIPTVFFTVYYALQHLADLQPGERVLIHGAAGGVGIAAIQLAKHLGAEVFATVGSAEKRDFVHLLGADHVFDSRSLDFADDILSTTRGEGVDIVLNSLAGEAIRRNLRILKPFGRFLELGKRDFFENTPIGLRLFKDNISYFGIDADQLLTGRPQLSARLFREVMQLFREGALSPLPHRTFPAERVVDAFRVMQQARHIGKVVVSLDNGRPAVSRPMVEPKPARLKQDATWIITGGLSGFGLETARWLAAQGVGNLVLLGRRGLETPGAREAVTTLLAQGVTVDARACDITDMSELAQVMDYIRNSLPPLQGIIHAAMVIDDKLISNLDDASLDSVLRPKLVGAWNLHEATLDIPLEHFVLYSSITTSLGNLGQASYVAANAGLEGLAELRRRRGLTAECIGWGPIGDTGYLVRNTAVRDSLGQRLGKAPLSAAQALAQLGSILTTNASPFVANFDWSTLSRILPSAGSTRFRNLNRTVKSTGPSEDDADFRTLLTGKTQAEIILLVQRLVTQEVAQILAIGAERINPVVSLHDLGLDSLMAVELALGLEQRLGIQLPVMMLNESPTVEKVTQRIIERMQGDANEEAPTDGAVGTLVQDLFKQHGETMTDEDVQRITEDTRALMQQDARGSA